MSQPKTKPTVVTKPAPVSVTVADINAELDSEYAWCGQSIPALLRAILRELVAARLRGGGHVQG